MTLPPPNREAQQAAFTAAVEAGVLVGVEWPRRPFTRPDLGPLVTWRDGDRWLLSEGECQVFAKTWANLGEGVAR